MGIFFNRSLMLARNNGGKPNFERKATSMQNQAKISHLMIQLESLLSELERRRDESEHYFELYDKALEANELVADLKELLHDNVELQRLLREARCSLASTVEIMSINYQLKNAPLVQGRNLVYRLLQLYHRKR